MAAWPARLALLLPVCLAFAACAVTGDAAAPVDSDTVPVERQIIVAVHDQRPGMQLRAGSISRPYGSVRTYRGSLRSQRQMADLARRHALRPVARWPIELLDVYCVVFEVPPGRSREQVLEQIAAESGVVIAQPMQTFTALARSSIGEAAGPPASEAVLDVRHAHRWATGRGVKVALIDTGVDRDHPDLEGRVLSEMDFVGPQGLAPAEEPHGLAVAGVIAARASPAPGVVGVAPGAQLLSLRACWHTDPVNAVCNSLTLARAIVAAVEQRADIVNLSLTGPSDLLLERLLNRAMERRLVVVGAVPERAPGEGDAGADTGARFPTSVPGVIPVQTAELADLRASGVLSAPGQNILTLRPGGGYDLASGSSLAAAHVTGVVALLLEHRAELGSDELRALLALHTRPLALDGRGTVEAVDACLAVASLVNGQCPAAVNRTAEVAPPFVPAPAASSGD
jgi:hypothetical protein